MPVFETLLLLLLSLLLLPANATVGIAGIRETPVVKAVRRVSPAVVNISSEYEVRGRPNPFSGFGMDPGFDAFFRDFFAPGIEERARRSSLGSGVIIDGEKGLILTNAHVIEKAGTVKVTLGDKREFTGEVVGADRDSDLAVLRISSDAALPDVAMGSSENIMIGETVIAIGNPFGFSNTVTTGVISATNRSIKTEDNVYHNFLQTDASINPGNSGGPLLNIEGDLIGINTAIYAKARGIGFAIPISRAKRIVANLIRHGEVVPAWTGIIVQDLDPNLATYLRVPRDTGVMITELEKGSPAARSGLRDGDIILSIGGRQVRSAGELEAVTAGFSAGEKLRIILLRDGKKRAFSLKTRAYPIELAPALAMRLLGLRVEDPPRRYRSGGVVISDLLRTSYLAGIGARPGDMIRRMDDMVITDKESFHRAVVKFRMKKSMVILLVRGNQGYYITVEL